jgi:hypothetical protein
VFLHLIIFYVYHTFDRKVQRDYISFLQTEREFEKKYRNQVSLIWLMSHGNWPNCCMVTDSRSKSVIIYFVNKYVPRRAHVSCRRSWSYVVLFMRILFVFALCFLIGILDWMMFWCLNELGCWITVYNSCKPITNMGWVRARLCKLQKRCTRLTAVSNKLVVLFMRILFVFALCFLIGILDWMMFWCFNATFSNISAISWRPVLVVEVGVYTITTAISLNLSTRNNSKQWVTLTLKSI